MAKNVLFMFVDFFPHVGGERTKPRYAYFESLVFIHRFG